MHKSEYYIIFDIERNFRPYQSDIPDEIIEIGAVKVAAETLEQVSYFSARVKPKSSLSRHTIKLTGLTKQDLKGAKRFPEVMQQFREFAGEYSIFVTWGKEDYAFLEEECLRYQLVCPTIEKKRRFDLQKFVFQAYEDLFPNQPSLKLAVEKLSLTWEGKQHRAFDDARNTANIFLKVAIEKDLSSSYRRKTDPLLVENGYLTDKGRKKLVRWIFKELKKGKPSSLTWEMFLHSRAWENAIDHHELEETAVELFRSYFDIALRKAKQQIHALAAMKKKATDGTNEG